MSQEKNDTTPVLVTERVIEKPDPWWMFQRPHYVGMEKLPPLQKVVEEKKHSSQK